HLGNLFLIVQLHFSKLFLILKSGVNHTSRGSISTSTLPSIKLRKCSSKIITSILSFIKMDNRIKLLEEILSFRMQGVEFDNGDMYVDGHKAASDVRDEFVSVTEKLMDELAQCYNVLPQLDINNTIDHR